MTAQTIEVLEAELQRKAQRREELHRELDLAKSDLAAARRGLVEGKASALVRVTAETSKVEALSQAISDLEGQIKQKTDELKNERARAGREIDFKTAADANAEAAAHGARHLEILAQANEEIEKLLTGALEEFDKMIAACNRFHAAAGRLEPAYLGSEYNAGREEHGAVSALMTELRGRGIETSGFVHARWAGTPSTRLQRDFVYPQLSHINEILPIMQTIAVQRQAAAENQQADPSGADETEPQE